MIIGYTKTNLKGIKHFIYQGAYVNDEYIPDDKYLELKNYYEFTKLLSVDYIENMYLEKKNDSILMEELTTEIKLSPSDLKWFFDSKNNKGQNINTNLIKLTKESKYSVTPWQEASFITNYIVKFFNSKDITITDATANIGGNSIDFYNNGITHVNSVEIDPKTCEFLKNNLKVYGYESNNVYCNDYIDVYKNLNQDCVFFDPPWGGPDYIKKDNLDLFLGDVNVVDIIKNLFDMGKIKLAVLKAPINYNSKNLQNIFKSDLYKITEEPIFRGKKHSYDVFFISKLKKKVVIDDDSDDEKEYEKKYGKDYETKVVNVKVKCIRPGYENLKEWTENPNNIYIGRSGIVFVDNKRFPEKSSLFANPFKIGVDGTRDEVLQKYREYIKNELYKDEKLRKILLSYKGKNLGCWCHPEPCHGDILAEMIEIFDKDELDTKIETENDFFKYITRAQITTGSGKTDSYFAKLKNNYKNFNKDEIVFVKGPFKNDDVYNILELFIKVKEILNIPYIEIAKIDLKLSDDFFTDEVYSLLHTNPHYIRTKLNKRDVYTFIIYKNLCGDNIYKIKYGDIKTQKSKIWIDSNVWISDWKKLNEKSLCKEFNLNSLKNTKYLCEYILSIYFRYLFGINDHANRNFVVSNNNLYSVDEENIDMDNKSNFSKLDKQFEFILDNWNNCNEYILNTLKNWNLKLSELEDVIPQKYFKNMISS